MALPGYAVPGSPPQPETAEQKGTRDAVVAAAAPPTGRDGPIPATVRGEHRGRHRGRDPPPYPPEFIYLLPSPGIAPCMTPPLRDAGVSTRPARSTSRVIS